MQAGRVLQQAELAAAGDGFPTLLDLELVENSPVVSLVVSKARKRLSPISWLKSPPGRSLRTSSSRRLDAVQGRRAGAEDLHAAWPVA
jgi:hypothetical protein